MRRVVTLERKARGRPAYTATITLPRFGVLSSLAAWLVDRLLFRHGVSVVGETLPACHAELSQAYFRALRASGGKQISRQVWRQEARKAAGKMLGSSGS